MYVIRASNVNLAYVDGLNYLRTHGVKESSRAGEVVVAPVPVVTEYVRPFERVLFNEQRDANPFFHLFESLWMLSGSDDATWLDQFVHDFSKRFAETNGLMHGAYGFRWRRHFRGKPVFQEGGSGGPRLPDQLATILELLRRDPTDRRVVLQMWDPVADLARHKRDVPCNIALLPRVNQGALDITILCRSNDAIWGAYGANAVHFSVLQEYLAFALGVTVGKYYQISNNFHAYVDVLERVGWPVALSDPYQSGTIRYTPLLRPTESVADFDTDVEMLVYARWPIVMKYKTSFFNNVAIPMLSAHGAWREKKYAVAQDIAETAMLSGSDWQEAAVQWMKRRREKWAK